MPGVTIRTATRSGPVNPDVPASGRYFVAAQFERGPAGVATLVRSLAQLEATFGGRVAYGSGYDDLRTYFEEEGTEAYVVRVVGTAATVGTLTLDNAEAVPAATLRIDALGAGAWSGDVTVTVEAGTVAGTYRLLITGPLDVERYDNLTTPADAVYALGSSKYVRAVDLGAGGIPAVAPAEALSAGTDDRATITATTMGNSLTALGSELGSGIVAIPGYSSALVGEALIDHARATRRLAALAPAQGASEADVIAAADALIDVDADVAGLFYPWVRVPMGGNATKLISPEGYVAAARARAHRDAGPWRSPAGEDASARFVLGTERDINRAEGDRLDVAGVSAIRSIGGDVRLYGWRSLSTDEENYALLTGRDVLNTIAVEAEQRLERFVHKPIDAQGILYASVAAELVGLVDPYRAAGGLFARVVDGQEVDPGYSIDVGPTVNTDATLARNTVAAVLALRVSPVGSTVELTIVKASLTATV